MTATYCAIKLMPFADKVLNGPSVMKILLHAISDRDMIDRLGHRRVILVDCNKSNQILAWRDSFDLKRVAESFLSFTIAHENKN